MKMFVTANEETPQMFKNRILNAMTLVHWTVPLILYIPVAGFLFYRVVTVFQMDWVSIAVLYVLGTLTWTLVEYVFHRYLFHFDAKSKLSKTMVWFSHGIHHDFPNDVWRLVLPPALSIPLAIGFYFFYTFIMGEAVGSIFLAGFLTGYMIYEIIHYSVHHFPVKGSVMGKLRANHLKHHFKCPDKLYGVSSPLWDVIFGTKLDK